MARREMSGASDFDYLILAHGLVPDARKFRSYRAACVDWCQKRALAFPGQTGIFGRVVSATELVEQIGLEFDTNASLTRRILLLEEGVSVFQPDLHRQLIEVTIKRYLDGQSLDEHGVPRFLVNDITRYWRTIAVDYQAKVWQRLDRTNWGLRYLKLRIPRKLTFVGSVIPLFLVSLREPRGVAQYLADQFVDLGEMRDRSVALQAALERLLLDAPALRGFGRRYLTF
jgi:hypothetical protein